MATELKTAKSYKLKCKYISLSGRLFTFTFQNFVLVLIQMPPEGVARNCIDKKCFKLIQTIKKAKCIRDQFVTLNTILSQQQKKYLGQTLKMNSAQTNTYPDTGPT